MSDEITVVESDQQPRNPQGQFAPKEAPAPVEPAAPEPEELHEDDEPVNEHSESEPAESVEPPEPAQPERKKNKTTEYIERLQNENREARAREADYQRRLAEIEARQPKPEAPKAPDPNSFYLDPLAYVQQTSEYAVQQARQQWEEQQTQAARQQKEQAVLQNFQTKAQAFAQAVPDFQQVIESVPPDLLPQDIAMAIIAHERSPELAYHLGKNRGELIRLATLPPQFVSYAIEDLASRLTAPQQEAPNPVAVPPTRAVTRAPAPVTTLSGSPAVSKSYEDMGMEDYDKRRIKERREKGLR